MKRISGKCCGLHFGGATLQRRKKETERFFHTGKYQVNINKIFKIFVHYSLFVCLGVWLVGWFVFGVVAFYILFIYLGEGAVWFCLLGVWLVGWLFFR